MRKKKYKLKLGVKLFFILLVILGVCSYYGYKYYQDYLYKHSKEYYLLELGYNKDQTKNIIDKLSEKEIDEILSYNYNEFIPEFVKTKYFMFEKLDEYLSQVITQEDNFFKYHGIDGYDYDYIVSKVNTNSHKEVYSDVTTTDISENFSMLVNKYNQLPSNYEPDDLVDISIKYRYGGEKKIRKEVMDAFLKMWEDAYNDGIYLIIDSGFRAESDQKRVYDYYEDLKGTKGADLIAARPGYSEHQTGLALDIYSKECADAKKFNKSKSYTWLTKNAYKYGFILRYPELKKDITGYNYESWHYRYLGRDLAKKVYDEDITYDEYYAYYLNKK